MPDPYKIEVIGSHKCGRILDADGNTIPIDPLDQRYGDFVTWASQQDRASFPVKGYEQLRSGTKYFCGESALIDHLKRNGLTLFVDLRMSPPFPFSGDRLVISHSQDTPNTDLLGPNKDVPFGSIFSAAPDVQMRNENAGLWASEAPVCYVSGKLFEQISDHLLDEDHEIRRLSSFPLDRTFVYVDVSAFSQHPVGHQVLIIQSLIRLTKEDAYPHRPDFKEILRDCESRLCIGDGYIYVFKHPARASLFAATLAYIIEELIATGKLIEFHFRMAVHTGSVYRFWDAFGENGGRWNYVGRGITEAERHLTAAGKDKDDVVYVSAITRQRMRSLPYIGDVYRADRWLQNRGRFKDKHDLMWRLYEVDHTGWAKYSGGVLPTSYPYVV